MSTSAVTPDQPVATPEGAAPQPDQQAPAAPQQPSGPAPTSGFVAHLAGALKGLALGGIPGAVVGGASPNTANNAWQQRKDMAQSQVDMHKAQAANLLADAHLREQQAQNVGPELAQRIKENDETTAKDFISRGITPVVVTHDRSPEAALEASKKVLEDGNHVVVLRMGDGYAAFDLNQMGQSPAMLNDVNDVRILKGQPPISAAQWSNSKMLNPGAKSNMLKDAATVFNPVPGKTLGEIDGQITQYSNLLATAQAIPDSQFINKDQRVKQLQKAVDTLQTQKKNLVDEQNTQVNNQIKVAGARGAAFNANRPTPVIDEDGNLKIVKAGDAEARGLAPAQQGAKAMSQQSQIGDIAQGSQNVRADIQKLNTPFTSQQVALLTQSMHSSNEKIISSAITALNNQNLSPEQKQFVVDIAQLHERALSLRSVAGMGQGSDQLRAAIVRLLPSAASGDREMMTKQLDAFDQQVTILGKGIPKVKTGGQPAAKTARPPLASFERK